jgi:hypothetical protein
MAMFAFAAKLGMATNAYALHIALGVFVLGQLRWRQALF